MELRIMKEISNFDHTLKKCIANGKEPNKMLNMTQMHVLMYLLNHKDEEVCQKDLEIETKLKKASMTGCLDSMQEKGIIIRKQSEDDKRRNLVLLTDFAKQKEKELKERIDYVENTIKENISEEELEKFLNTIEKMKDNLKKAGM